MRKQRERRGKGGGKVGTGGGKRGRENREEEFEINFNDTNIPTKAQFLYTKHSEVLSHCSLR